MLTCLRWKKSVFSAGGQRNVGDKSRQNNRFQ